MPVEDHRVIALLRRGGAGELEERAAAVVGSWAVPAGGRARVLVRDDGAPLAGTHFAELCPDLEPWDVAVDVWSPAPDLTPFRDLRTALGDSIDPTTSRVLAGPQWRARKPPTDYGLTFCVTRRADL